MEPKSLARALAGGRVAIGLALFVAPAAAGRAWLGDAVDDAGGRIAVRALGARDVVLGVGTWTALDTDADLPGAPRWLEAGAAADLADATAVALSRRGRPAPVVAGSIAIATGAAALALWVRGALARQPLIG